MANKFRGEAAILRSVEDGGNLTLVIDANAFCEIEDVTGDGLEAVIQKMATKAGVRLSFVRALLYAGLKRNHALTLEQAGDLITDVGLEPIIKAITEAMQAALPKAGAKGEALAPSAPKPKKKHGTGTPL